VRRSIFGVGTRLRATLVWRLLERLSREENQRSSGRSISSEIEAPRSSGTSASAEGRADHVWQDSSEASWTHVEGWFFGIGGRCAPSHGLLADRLSRFFGSDENENWNSASVGTSGTTRFGQCKARFRSRGARTPRTLRSTRELVLTVGTALRRRSRQRSE